MASVARAAGTQRIDHFFSMPAARADRWRELTAVANDWIEGAAKVGAVRAALDALGAIEEVLRSQPGCADAVVVKAPDARWGERPVAFAAGPEADDAAALEAIAASLGPVARPDRLIRVPELPLLPSGKPDRAALAARALSQP